MKLGTKINWNFSGDRLGLRAGAERKISAVYIEILLWWYFGQKYSLCIFRSITKLTMAWHYFSEFKLSTYADVQTGALAIDIFHILLYRRGRFQERTTNLKIFRILVYPIGWFDEMNYFWNFSNFTSSYTVISRNEKNAVFHDFLKIKVGLATRFTWKLVT